MAATTPARIRPFQPGDRSQVLALAPRLTEGVASWRNPAAVRRAVQDWVTTSIGTADQPDHAVYVAIAMGRVVGVVTIREQTHFTGQTDAYVGELAVAPGMERRGIATALMNAAEAWAAQRGLAFLTLQTGAANQPARSLYRQLGYHEEELLLTKAISARHKHGQPHPAEGLTTTSAGAAQHMMTFWACRGPFGDVRRVLTSLAEAAPQRSVAQAWLLWVAAVMAHRQNDYAVCAALYDTSRQIGIELRDLEVVAWSLLVGAIPLWAEGDLTGAKQRLESAVTLAELMQVEHVELDARSTLCGVLTAAGELDRAIELGEQSLAMSKRLGELWVRGFALNYLGQATWLRGARPRGEVLAREAAACKHALDDRNGLAIVLETLAWMAAELGQHERAAHLLGAAERVRHEISQTLIELFRTQHERSESAARRGLGTRSYDVAFARGRAMTIDEGVAFAVGGTQRPKPAPAVKPEPLPALTGRQLEIARLIAYDLSNKQIAARLFLSERTVETHITNMLNKLGLGSRVQISRWVTGLNEPG